MKKLIAVLALFAILFSLAACQKDGKTGFDIAETKDIVLGKEVSSVVLVTGNGEEITCTNEADFYEIFNKISGADEDGKKHSCVAETKLGDNSKSYANMNVYYTTKGRFLESTVKKDGEDAFAVIEVYDYYRQLPDKTPEMRQFSKYTYKEEQAFGGAVRDANGYRTYSSDAYPMIPQTGTELNDMYVRSGYLNRLMQFTELFQSYEPYEANSKTYDFNELVTREYTLYENYIVFKQTAPFLYFDIRTGVNDPDILYASFANADCSITQEAYCNVKTGEIEFVKVYGDTLWYAPQYFGQKMEINATIYIHDVDEAESEKKVNQLIEYIETNAD